MNILVTGGAGYVGSIVVDSFIKKGNNVIVIDNLSSGHRKAINSNAKFYRCDITDFVDIRKVFMENKIDMVLHLAAEASIEKSVTNPSIYFNTNVIGGINILDTMVKYNVKSIIFSSCASMYGNNNSGLCKETDGIDILNSYAESKLMFEKILEWYRKAYGIDYITFRFFKVAGSTKEYGEDHNPETHLIPNILQAAIDKKPVNVFGNDYNTKDGTCIRDFIHVEDVVSAIELAITNIKKCSGSVFNLSGTKGYSVIEIINASKEVTGLLIDTKVCKRRLGDPAVLKADSNLVRSKLGWIPQYTDIKDIIKTDWEWKKNNPNGYKDD